MLDLILVTLFTINFFAALVLVRVVFARLKHLVAIGALPLWIKWWGVSALALEAGVALISFTMIFDHEASIGGEPVALLVCGLYAGAMAYLYVFAVVLHKIRFKDYVNYGKEQ